MSTRGPGGADTGDASSTADGAGGDPWQAPIRELLGLMGEDPARAGLRATPRRVAESLAYLTRGYGADVDAIMAGAIFEQGYDEMVLVRGITLFSLCEHHLLPFFGQAHVAYVPNGRVIGLSKLPRVVDAFARRLQVQERLTTEIAQAIDDHLKPKGVAVVIEADHLCMMMRGVERNGSKTITSSMTGVFRRDPRTRAEFLGLIREGR